MAIGELVAATVADQRVFDTHGEAAPAGIYLLAVPGRALPFTIYRAWKVPTGTVSEEVRFTGPTGRLVWRWGPRVRRMLGSMDLTVEADRVEDAIFDEAGVHLVSFILDDEVVGQIEVPVYVQQAPTKLPREVEEGLRKSDVIWVGAGNAKGRVLPAWFVYRGGKIYVLSQREPGSDEQVVPGLSGGRELLVITRRKADRPERRGRDTALDRFHASVRILEGEEWEEAARFLADRRRSRAGPPEDAIARWRGTCDIAELTPLIPT